MLERVAYFEHGADMGVVGRGACVEEAFENAARAMFALMSDIDCVHPSAGVAIEFTEADRELALVSWLNLLLGEARSRSLLLCRFRLRHDGAHWQGSAEGAPWTEAMERGVEVKGATLTCLEVTEREGEWEARCVVDL